MSCLLGKFSQHISGFLPQQKRWLHLPLSFPVSSICCQSCKSFTCWVASFASLSLSQSHTFVALLRFLKYHFPSSPFLCHWSWRENWHRLSLSLPFSLSPSSERGDEVCSAAELLSLSSPAACLTLSLFRFLLVITLFLLDEKFCS